jgi:hypothetical protein
LRVSSAGRFRQLDFEHAPWDFGTNNFTVSVWVNRQSFCAACTTAAYNTPNYSCIVGKWWSTASDGTGTGEWSLNHSTLQDGKPNFTIRSGNTNRKVTAETVFNTDQWYYVTAMREGGYIRIFVNGVLENSVSSPENCSV